MTKAGELVFTLLSWWRVGAGRGEGGLLDDVCARGPGGLPWIPGATVKGLAREAMTELCTFGHCKQTVIDALFGKPMPGGPDQVLPGRFLTTEGQAKFDAAQLSLEWQQWATIEIQDKDPEEKARKKDMRAEIIAALFSRRAMTAVDARGGAQDGSLRTVEVAAPMVLTAPVWITGDTGHLDALHQAAPLIRRIGMGRNRGFGRVSVTFEKAGSA